MYSLATATKRRWTSCTLTQYNLSMGVVSWKDARATAVVTALARVTVTLLLSLTLSATAFARSHKHASPQVHLFPTAGSLEAQNSEADRLRLPRIQNVDELHELVQDGELAPIRTTALLRVEPKGEHAVLRPWAADFLSELTLQSSFVLTVSSAVRTVREQKRLRRWNHNAAATTGPEASVHPTGIAFDIAKKRLTRAQQCWLRLHLFYLQSIGKVIVEEEFRHPCFHIVVIKP
jgi:Family of unknown function (DUF5715)